MTATFCHPQSDSFPSYFPAYSDCLNPTADDTNTTYFAPTGFGNNYWCSSPISPPINPGVSPGGGMVPSCTDGSPSAMSSFEFSNDNPPLHTLRPRRHHTLPQMPPSPPGSVSSTNDVFIVQTPVGLSKAQSKTKSSAKASSASQKRESGESSKPASTRGRRRKSYADAAETHRPSYRRDRFSSTEDVEADAGGHADGDGDDIDDSNESRAERRRELNRHSARKCRSKAKAEVDVLQSRMWELNQRHEELLNSRRTLEAQIYDLKQHCLSHVHCNCTGIRQYLFKSGPESTRPSPTMPGMGMIHPPAAAREANPVPYYDPHNPPDPDIEVDDGAFLYFD